MASPQPRAEATLPSAEIYVSRPGLTLSLHTATPAVRLGEHLLALFDKRRGAQLPLREFSGRYVDGCDRANRALNELTGQKRTVDCRYPEERARAAAEWKQTVGA